MAVALTASPQLSDADSRALAESASLAMVREFLAKKKYKRTLETLYSELPCKPPPTKTSEVAKALGLSKLLATNSASAKPFETLLECLVQQLVQKLHAKLSSGHSGSSAGSYAVELKEVAAPAVNAVAPSRPSTATAAARNGFMTAADRPAVSAAHTSAANQHSAASSDESWGQRPRTADTHPQRPAPHASVAKLTGPLAVPVPIPVKSRTAASDSDEDPEPATHRALLSASSVVVSNSAVKLSAASLSALSKMSIKVATESRLATAALPSVPKTKSAVASIKRTNIDYNDDELLMQDVDEFEHEEKEAFASAQHSDNSSAIRSAQFTSQQSRNPIITQTPSTLTTVSSLPSSAPIALAEAQALRTLVFGEVSATNGQAFTAPWLGQGFYYNTTVPTLSYGLVQREGGPCGLIAAVQATVLKQLFFGKWRGSISRTISVSDQNRALSEALAEILWRAGGQRSAKICTRGSSVGGSSGPARKLGTALYKPDGLTEALEIHSFASYASLLAFVTSNLSIYSAVHGSGLVLVLYSLILSRGIDETRGDFDYPTSSLIGQHSYCTQELVNLALTGFAVANVFDGHKSMGETQLKGQEHESDIGVLSLFEHFGYIEVGSKLKCPRFPIWVVCSESHYTVLWSMTPAVAPLTTASSSQVFELYYYDELIQQDDEIRLSVDCSNLSPAPRSKDLEPPINDCIRTKFGRHARIDWNDTEPIL